MEEMQKEFDDDHHNLMYYQFSGNDYIFVSSALSTKRMCILYESDRKLEPAEILNWADFKNVIQVSLPYKLSTRKIHRFTTL